MFVVENGSARNIGETTMASNGNDEFEILDSSAVTFARRGRPSSVNPLLVEKLKSLPAGKSIAIKSMAHSPSSPEYKKHKARVSAQIRTACREAQLKKFDIRWTLDGVPMVVRP